LTKSLTHHDQKYKQGKENCRVSKKNQVPVTVYEYMVCPHNVGKKAEVNTKTTAYLGRPHRDWTAMIRKYSAKQFWK
jgi:hypothetical protein